MLVVGFDIGGTKMEGALIRFLPATEVQLPSSQLFPYRSQRGELLRGEVLGRMRVPTERHLGYDQMVLKLQGLLKDLCSDQKILPQDLKGAGFAIPGAVDPTSLKMIIGNTLVLKDRGFVQDVFGDYPHVALSAENDANCFALAEALCGAGFLHAQKAGAHPNDLCSVGIILGTGCGGGIVANGKTWKGRRGGAGEIGHTVLVENGLTCWCGQRGCAEQYISGSGLEQQINGRLYSQIQGQKSAREIFELAAAQDPVALGVLKAYRRNLAQFLAGLANTFDPDFFVLGGGLSLQSAIYDGVEAEVQRLAFLPSTLVPLYQNALGDSAGVVGAALLAMAKIL
jgi:fructokinase